MTRIHYGPSSYWPNRRVASERGGPLTHRAQKLNADYRRAAAKLDVQVAEWYRRRGQSRPVDAPTVVGILASYPPVLGAVAGSLACGGSKDIEWLIDNAAASLAQREWRSIGARSLAECKAVNKQRMRRRVSFVTAHAHARLRLSRLDIIAHGGRSASRHAAFGASSLTSPTAYEAATAGALGRGGGRVGTRGAGPPA